MAARTFFVTGTDTGVGKTVASCALLRALRQRGIDAVGYKPVASGCESGPEGLRNEDALALLAASGGSERYEAINPVAYAPPIAPHLAAEQAGRPIRIAQLDAGHAALAARHELVIVEGAGGWQVPLNGEQTFADWVGARGWPVLLVVGLRLGCISHALLSAESISRRTALAGWIANRLPPLQPEWVGNLEAIRPKIGAPLLGILPERGAPDDYAAALATEALWQR